jgi:hypothetical protein
MCECPRELGDPSLHEVSGSKESFVAATAAITYRMVIYDESVSRDRKYHLASFDGRIALEVIE